MIAASLGAGNRLFRQRPFGNVAIAASLWRNAGFLVTLVALLMALGAPSWLDRQKSNPLGEPTGEISIAKDAADDDTDSGSGNGAARPAILQTLGLPVYLSGRHALRIAFPRSAALAPKPAAFIVPLANGPPSRKG